ncbi:MAG: Tm-1-like ATP-binding domain-containing protein [Rhodospirillaceae bacterium]|jgi:uncharacterized protein (UPF0261 family)|nr:Tm-1-like ATP-binding domain-containing protein [Rhodospirillaceae bacterium]
MAQAPTVVVVATLDTKGIDADFVRGLIEKRGLATLLVDVGVLDDIPVTPDFTREQIAEHAGTTLAKLTATKDKGLAITTQSAGLVALVQELFDQGQLSGIIGLGGGQGTSIISPALRALPVGVPKLMVSTVASGKHQFGSYVGSRDICMMYSVADIQGLNKLSRPILENAANAIAGMVAHQRPVPDSERRAVAITMMGVTTPGVQQALARFEAKGFDGVPFHAVGSGRTMEELAGEGMFTGILDYSTHEIIDDLFGGVGGAPERLSQLSRTAIPAVISVGACDYMIYPSPEHIPQSFQGRPTLFYNPQMTFVQPSPDDMTKVAGIIAERLNQALGPTLMLIPKRGFSAPNIEGGPLWGPEGNQAMIDGLRQLLKPEVPLVTIDAHINDAVFADTAADALMALIGGAQPSEVASELQK